MQLSYHGGLVLFIEYFDSVDCKSCMLFLDVEL